jgi:23S rRNA pseudouridine1911/1915/1917 synthase
MTTGSSFLVPEDVGPDRADKVLAACLAGEQSRSSLARLMRQGHVLVNGRPVRPSSILQPGDRVELLPEDGRAQAVGKHESPHFSVLFEDEDLIVVDKPAGLVVHPGAGRPAGTLVDALIETRPQMLGVGEPGRWGVVHRLDRDTSGVMVLAKTAVSHSALSALFKRHSIRRVYLALVRGDPGQDEGTINTPLGRHRRDRKRMSTSTLKPRQALTRWKVRARYGGLTLLEVAPETGRTHQIRAHLAYAGLPIAGDPTYGRKRGRRAAKDPLLRDALALLKRQALHAATLGFVHPVKSEYVEFSSPVPTDIAEALSLCEKAKRDEP